MSEENRMQAELDESVAEIIEQEPAGKEPEVEAESEPVTVQVTDEDKPVNEGSKKNFNKRIQTVIAQREEARREAEQARLELVELRKQTQTQQQTGQATGDQFDKPKPEMHTFGTIGEYTEALSDWKDEQREFNREQKARTSKMQELAQKNAETWINKEKAVKTDIEDYDAVVNVDSIQTIGLSNQTHLPSRNFLNESEFGPQVLYELLQNDELASKFKAATPLHQIKMLTKIETEIEAKTKTENKVVDLDSGLKIPPKLKGGVKVVPKTLDTVAATGDFGQYIQFRKSMTK